MKLVVSWLAVIGLALIMGQAQAVAPAFDASALPQLQQEPQHGQAAIRVAAANRAAVLAPMMFK